MSEKQWGDYQIAVTSAIERLTREQDALRDKVAAQDSKIAVLEFRAGAWGAIGAGVVIVLMLLTGKA